MDGILIVGNGVIGSLAAVEIARANPQESVTLLGPIDRHLSASVAAGAMANVFAELEHWNSPSLQQERDFALSVGIEGSRGWRAFIAERAAEDLMTALDTLVFLQKNPSDFERRNFEHMKSVVLTEGLGDHFESNQVERMFDEEASPKTEGVLIRGEFALDARRLFKLLDAEIELSGVKRFPGEAMHVDPMTGKTTTVDGQVLSPSKTLVANGATAGHILPTGSVIGTIQGFGVAYLLDPSPGIGDLMREKVVRTVNRGGAQCGLHTVPQSGGGLYLGAGNTIVESGKKRVRVETLRYLVDRFQREFSSKDKSYDFEGTLLMGSRPKTLDGFPAIGPIGNGKVFVATGTNRAGLTWAPKIVSEILRWFGGQEISSEFSRWDPERKPRSFASLEEALEYFVESRNGAASEHGLEPREGSGARRSSLREIGRNLFEEARQKNPRLFESSVIHPDHWGVLSGRTF